MKKILFWAAISAFAFSSCAKNETVEAPKGKQMSFYSYVGKAKPVAKGTPVGTSFANGATMGIVAFEDIMKFDVPYVTIDNVKLTVTGGTPQPDSPIYWPTEGKLNFFAYAPYEDANLVYNDAVNATTAPTVTYTVPAVANQVDVLVATPLKDQTSTNGQLALAFKHALAQVKFSAMTDQDYAQGANPITFTVKSVTVKQVISKGTLSLNAENAPAWALDAAKADYPIGLATTLTVGNTQAPLNAADGVLMLLPQTHADDAVIELIYTETVGGIVSADITKSVKINTVTLSGTADKDWKANQVIHYVFTLAKTGITFSGAITGWDAENTGSI